MTILIWIMIEMRGFTPIYLFRMYKCTSFFWERSEKCQLNKKKSSSTMSKSYEEFFFSLNIIKDFYQKPDDDLAFKQSNKFKEKT